MTNLIIAILSFSFFILQIFYMIYWKNRRKKFNKSGKVELSDTSSIVKMVSVLVALLISSIFFFLKFLNTTS